MGYRLFAISVLLAALSVIGACSSLPRRVEVTTVPAGAEVQAPTGETLGMTPVVLEKENLNKVLKDGKINILVSAPGHMPRELLLDFHGNDAHEIQLLPYRPSYFSERLIHDFSSDANAMARGIAEIQSFIYARKLNEAERMLQAFQVRFPNIAASYVLYASLESLRGDPEKAKRYLLRARTLDPTDPVAARMLSQSAPILARAKTGLQTPPPKTKTAQTQAPVKATRTPASAKKKRAQAKKPTKAPAPATAPAGGGQ